MQTSTTSTELVQLKRSTRPMQTPGDVLNFWFGETGSDVNALEGKQALWWKKSDETDTLIANRGVELVAKLASGLALKWSARGPAERLAAIVGLDQFTRNIFRNTPAAFENDALALALCKEGLGKGEDKVLSPVKRWFFYMPLEHSEDIKDQERCVGLLKELVAETDDSFRPAIEGALDFARQHRDVITRFGRFPHRNFTLGRSSTKAEKDYLAKPGAGF